MLQLDYHIRTSKLIVPISGGLILAKPTIPGADYSGIVVASTLSSLKPGDRVFGSTPLPVFGTLGEYVVVGKGYVIKVADNVPLDQAACVGITGLTAFQTIVPHVKSGGKVFINAGSGGVGTFSLQIAKAYGCEVTTSCSGPNVELYVKDLSWDRGSS